MSEQPFPYHDESVAWVEASPDRVFDYMDDPKAAAAHMDRSSTMMMGMRMSPDVDAGGGRVIGSRIRMNGRMLGLPLSLEEVITERVVPSKKTWQTTGSPRLLVIAQYRMGFEVRGQGDGSRVRVFIDYSLPSEAPESWLGRLLGGTYARWCTKQMVDDACRHFHHSCVLILTLIAPVPEQLAQAFSTAFT